MKRFGIGLLYGVGGYLMTTVISYLLVVQFSSNSHDRGVEAAMTSIFVCGPLGALLALVTGIIRGRTRQYPPPTTDSSEVH